MLAVTTAIRLPATVPTLQSLWQVDAIEARLAAHIQLLQQSMANLANKSSDQQLAETFILGGEGIHLLSLDPLLPREFFNVSLRRQLTELMKEYDNIGKHYWMQRFNNSLTMSPSHLQPSLQQTLLPAYHR